MGSGIVQNRRIISKGRSSLYLDYYPGVFDRMRSNAPTVITITKKPGDILKIPPGTAY